MRTTINTLCLIALATVVVLVALVQAKGVLAPITAAFVLGVVMTPLSELWEKLRLPGAIAAFLSVLLALATIVVILLLFEPYMSKVLRQGPIIQSELRETVEELRRMLRGIEEMSDDVTAAIEANGDETEETAPSEEASVAFPTVADALFYAPQFLAQFLIFTGTLYFFLLARNSVYDWLTSAFTALGRRDLRRAASQVSRYVLTISAINFTLGVATALAMYLIGMPSPIVWGMLAFLLNFLLYLGPTLLIAMLTVTGIVVFEGAASLLPPAVYVALNAVEAQFITPSVVGKSLAVNPLLVFLSLVFWLWLWGPIGGIIAIPLLIWVITVTKGMGEPSESAQTISAGTPGRI